MPFSVGSESAPHTAAISTRAAASATGRPPGKRFPIAPASKAPRSPARRGIHAIFALLELAKAATALSTPALSAARSPTKITDFPVKDCEAIAAASCPGTTFTNSPLSFSTPIESLVAIAVTFKARLRTCLLRRKKTIGDSSSGSKPTRRTWSARSISVYRVVEPTTCAARNSRSSSDESRERKSISFVPRATRANLLYP